MDLLLQNGYVLKEEKEISALAIHNNYFKRINNPLVLCEENDDKLSFHIVEYAVSKSMTPQYELSICFCKNGNWWNLKCYSINQSDLTKDKLIELESKMVEMFLSIANKPKQKLKIKYTFPFDNPPYSKDSPVLLSYCYDMGWIVEAVNHGEYEVENLPVGEEKNENPDFELAFQIAKERNVDVFYFPRKANLNIDICLK